MVDLKALRCFVVVAELLSVSKAAPLLHISQSALSRQIQGLEEALGIQLFDRVGKRLVLTAEGEDLFPRAASLVDQALELSSRVQSMVRGEVGLLRIGATPQTIEGLLSGVLVSMRKKYPSIETSLVEGPNDYLLEQLQLGTAHVAIAALPERHDFEYKELFMGRLFAVVPAQHKFPAGETADIRTLATHPVLLLRRGFMTRSLFDRACLAAAVRPHALLESDSTQTILSLADAGHGVAIVSSTAINHRAPTDKSRIVSLTLDGKPLGQMICAVWNPRRSRSSILNPFLRELDQHVASSPVYRQPRGRRK
ncbi:MULTISPECIES: LysR family transcriptional regulator [unclassified Cupriavidus]|uniref:LysR family transcriptional regulator n=1 Tax=unclassified Cupriavidus TaxID=2640874 RepID=UPI00313D1878